MAWLDRIKLLYDAWALQVVVLFSFALHVLLVLFAGIRRRRATGVRRSILWVADLLVDSVAKYFLSHLSLSSTSQQQQLVAFWASFLLQHLGRPDNISAYTLEDNKLSARQVINVVQTMGVFYVLWKHIPFGGGGTLFLAAWIMFPVGVVKYWERTWALWWGDLGSIRSSGEEQGPRRFRADPCGGRELDDERALQVAHRMFHISRGAFADYLAVEALKDPLKRPDYRDTESFPHGWKGMCKVVEMELSLMYDILYTKAARVHTWSGYLLRFVSPPLTVVAFLLFWFYNKAGQRRVDVAITYILLAATFLVDLRWLLRALGSTWTYAFLNEMASTRWCWLHHKLLCSGRWHRLRRVVVSLDPRRLLGKEPASYRKWSGTIGQYNLLHECTHDTASLFRTMARNVGLEDGWNEYQYHYWGGLDISKKFKEFKELLFDRIRQELEKQFKKEPAPSAGYPLDLALAAAAPPDEDERRRRKLDEALGFNPEIGEQILTLHIATDVFLRCSDQNAAPCTCVKAIKALSDYMVFLVAVRPYMLPGLTLSSLHKATRDALKKIRRCSSTTRQKELACKLREMEKEPSTKGNTNRSLVYDSSIILSDGTLYADVLLQLLKNDRSDRKYVLDKLVQAKKYKERFTRLLPGLWDDAYKHKPLLEIIFDGWVRMLIYVSVRCSRDSHAKQLSRGGELTTIVWILAVHVGIFGIPVCESDEKYCSSSSISMFGCLSSLPPVLA